MSSALSSLPADWSAVLDTIQESLARTLSEMAEREQALALDEPAPLRRGQDDALRESLAEVAERMLLFQSCLGQAEASAAEAESALADGERAIQTWLAAAEGAGRRLAKAAPGDV